MQDRQTHSEPIAGVERRHFEASPLHQIGDSQMVNLIACPGVEARFALDTVTFASENYQTAHNETTQALYIFREGTLLDREGKPYNLQIQRDLDSAVIRVEDPATNTTILKVGLRDRELDGTPHATSAGYLKSFDNTSDDNIPQRSTMLGNVDWHYSSERDLPLPGQRAVEISVIASDPAFHLETSLRAKAERRSNLWVENSTEFARFIDDPFATLPTENPSQEALSKWYGMWWQVASRALAGKSVPLPGQTSQRSFDGFLEHAVSESAKHLSELNYTHLSAVPTWHYVWRKFQRLGFQPDHMDIHEASANFFDRLANMQLPNPDRRGEKYRPIDVMQQRALIAWLAVLPYALQLNTEFVPNLNIPKKQAEQFKQLFTAVKQELTDNDGSIATYPLAPGRNVWYSLSLK